MKRSNIDYSGKRCFDLLFSTLLLSLLMPFLFLIALGILLSSKGKIIYTQKRLGKEGRIFTCYKFRTMHENAEALLEELLKDTQLKKEWEEKQKLSTDPRVFAFGKFLRKTSLDELPQFFNVLRGDLSIVGPRPYMQNQKIQMGLFAKKILSIHPGITGLWQTSGRNATSFKERIYLDALYVDLRTFFFDLQIIGKTVMAVLFPKDAY